MASQWRVQLFDGLSLVDEITVPSHQMSTKDVAAFGRALLARFLNIEELAACYVNRRKGAIQRARSLDGRLSGNPYKIEIGDNPHILITVLRN